MLAFLVVVAAACSLVTEAQGAARGGAWGSRVPVAATTPLLSEQIPLRGKKIVANWNGDVVDAGAAFGTGLAASVAVKLLSGVAYQVALVATVIAVGSWTGIIAVNWQRLLSLTTSVIPMIPTREDLAKKLDLDGDGKLTGDDVDTLKSELKKFAHSNEHSAAGGVAGLLLGLLLL